MKQRTLGTSIDDFLKEVIGEVVQEASLEERARTRASIGAMLRDVYSVGYPFHIDSVVALVGRTMAMFESEAAHSLDESITSCSTY